MTPTVVRFVLVWVFSALAVAWIIGYIVSEFRSRALAEVQAELLAAADRGRWILEEKPLDLDACRLWSQEVVELMSRRLDDELVEEFTERIRDLLAGAELTGYRRSTSSGRGDVRESRPAEKRARENLRDAVSWLRFRTRQLGPAEMRGALWWLRG